MVLRTGLQALLTRTPSAMLYKLWISIKSVMKFLIQVRRGVKMTRPLRRNAILRSSSAEGEYLYPINTTNYEPGTPRQGDLFRGVNTVGSLSLSGKLDRYRRKKSEEYERASQRWAECSLEEWLAGPDGE